MNTSVALRSSFSVGKDGAILILRSRGSIPYGNVAPASVRRTPASAAFATIFFAQPSSESKEIKYPPFGFVHVPISSYPISRSSVASTSSNFGLMIAACSFICSRIFAMLPKKRTCLS